MAAPERAKSYKLGFKKEEVWAADADLHERASHHTTKGLKGESRQQGSSLPCPLPPHTRAHALTIQNMQARRSLPCLSAPWVSYTVGDYLHQPCAVRMHGATCAHKHMLPLPLHLPRLTTTPSCASNRAHTNSLPRAAASHGCCR